MNSAWLKWLFVAVFAAVGLRFVFGGLASGDWLSLVVGVASIIIAGLTAKDGL